MHALLFAFAILFGANTWAQPDATDRVIAYHNQKRLDAENLTLEDAETQLGYCIRSLVENVGGGFVGFDSAIKFLEKIQTFPVRPASFIVNRIKRCEYLKKHYSGKAVWRSKKLDFVRVNQSRIDPKAFSVLTAILYPSIACTKGSFILGLGVYYQGGIRIEGATCKSSTGRRWFEVRGGGGGSKESGTLHIGLGVMMKDYRNSTNRRAPVASQSYSVDGGHMIVGYTEDKDTGSDWGGIGIGVYNEKGKVGVLRLIPLGSKDEDVRRLTTSLY